MAASVILIAASVCTSTLLASCADILRACYEEETLHHEPKEHLHRMLRTLWLQQKIQKEREREKK